MTELDAVPLPLTIFTMTVDPAMQLFPEVRLANCADSAHILLATAIVLPDDVDSATNEGSSVTEPSDFVQALEMVHLTVPEVFDPEP